MKNDAFKRDPLRQKLPQRKWSAKDLSLLGTMTDQALADQLRRTHEGVQSMRIRRKIDAYDVRKTHSSSKVKEWTKEDERMLGKISDPQLASLLGRSRTDVQQHRIALDIPAKSNKTSFQQASWSRANERKRIESGARRLPGGVLPADAVAALDKLRAAGYAQSSVGCIARALVAALSNS